MNPTKVTPKMLARVRKARKRVPPTPYRALAARLGVSYEAIRQACKREGIGAGR